MLAIGLMSGTSLDGVDAALIETDGEGLATPIAFSGEAYSDAARAQLAQATAIALTYEQPCATPPLAAASDLSTRIHALAVRKLLREAQVDPGEVEVIGYHGQTVAHRPDRGWTWQIGDGAALAEATGIRVVSDFRSADVAAGGQGAPLLPVYHAALVRGLAMPVAVLNLGGVANITFIGADGALVAFDTGPANGLIDTWVETATGARFDEGGDVVTVKTNPRGDRLAIARRKGPLTLWDVSPKIAVPFIEDELLESACGHIGRGLTAEEWATYLPGRPFAPSCS